MNILKLTDVLETETCTRCCGSGRYSWCQEYGDTCFRCGGKGRTYTKKGAATKAWFIEQLERPAEDVKVGDWVWWESFSGKGYWKQVAGIEENGGYRSHTDKDGNEVREYFMDLVLKDGHRISFIRGETKIRVNRGHEGMQALIAQAAAYQANLTKAGKPRKRAAKAR